MSADPADKRPDPNTRPCADCGHVWFAGERRHEYAGGSGDQDEVLCVLCRQFRDRAGAGPRTD